MFGGFSSIVAGEGLAPTFTLDATGNVFLSIRRNDVPLANFALTDTARAVAQALDRLDAGDFAEASAERAFLEELASVTGPELETSLPTLAGEVYAATPLLQDALFEAHKRAVQRHGPRIGAPGETRFWVGAIDSNHRLTDGEIVSARLNGLGAIWGMDRQLTDGLGIGAAIAYSEANTSAGSFREGGDTTLWTATAYANGETGNLVWAFAATAGKAETEVNRTTVRRSTQTLISSKEGSNIFGANAELFRPFQFGATSQIAPLIAFNWRSVQSEGLNEPITGGVGLTFDGTTLERIGLEIGGQFAHTSPLADSSAAMFVDADVRARFDLADTDSDRVARLALAPDRTAYVLDGAEVSSSSLVAEATTGIEFERFKLALSARGTLSDREEAYELSASVSARF